MHMGCTLAASEPCIQNLEALHDIKQSVLNTKGQKYLLDPHLSRCIGSHAASYPAQFIEISLRGVDMSKKFYSLLQRALRKAANIRFVDKRKGFELIEVEALQSLFNNYQVDCVFDVGANVGQYASLIREKVRYHGSLISFEPQPDAFATLSKRAAKDDFWYVESSAISSTDGNARFNISHGSEFSSLHAPVDLPKKAFHGAQATYKAIDIITERLESAVDRIRRELHFKRPFLKLDTQGHDHDIIMSSKSTIRDFIAIQTELSIRPLYENTVDYMEAIKSYEELGFFPCAFFPNNFGHFPHLYEIDGIFIRDDLLEQRYV